MAALPGSDWGAIARRSPATLGTVRHVFTHFVLELEIIARSEPAGEGWWQPLDRLGEAGLPTLYRRAAEVALKAREPSRAAA